MSEPITPSPSTNKKAKPKTKPRVSKTKRRAAPSSITPEQLQQMIAEAAYLRAEQRGFVGGDADAITDWLAAEQEITHQLASNQPAASKG